MRAVNASSDPAGVAAALAARANEWLPLSEWSVMALEPDGSVRRIDAPEPEPFVRTPAHEIAEIVVRGGKAALRTTSYVTDRLAVGGDRDGRAEVTVLGWPLVAGGEVTGVLVGRRPRTAARGCPSCRATWWTRWRCWSSRRPSRWPTRCGWPGPRRCRSPTTSPSSTTPGT